MLISEVNEQTIYSAAQVHAASWRESYRRFCSAEFVAQHTTQRQVAHLQRELDAGNAAAAQPDGFCAGGWSEPGKTLTIAKRRL